VTEPVWFSAACAATLRHGDEGAEAWMDDAPGLAARLAERWGVVLGEPLHGGHTGLVAGGSMDGKPVVVKLVRKRGSAVRERRSLGVLAASGRVPGVLAWDDEHGFLVTERIEASRRVGVGELDAVVELAQVLHAVAAGPRITRVRDVLDGRVAAVLRHAAALGVAEQHVHDAVPVVVGKLVVCHGDFGPANVLVGATQVWAIDPECVVGPAAMDLAGFAIRAGAEQAVATAEELAGRYGANLAAVLAWLRWMAVDEALSHAAYGVEFAAEWALAVELGALPTR
jgi:streptomycin 6-kinase